MPYLAAHLRTERRLPGSRFGIGRRRWGRFDDRADGRDSLAVKSDQRQLTDRLFQRLESGIEIPYPLVFEHVKVPQGNGSSPVKGKGSTQEKEEKPDRRTRDNGALLSLPQPRQEELKEEINDEREGDDEPA